MLSSVCTERISVHGPILPVCSRSPSSNENLPVMPGLQHRENAMLNLLGSCEASSHSHLVCCFGPRGFVHWAGSPTTKRVTSHYLEKPGTAARIITTQLPQGMCCCRQPSLVLSYLFHKHSIPDVFERGKTALNLGRVCKQIGTQACSELASTALSTLPLHLLGLAIFLHQGIHCLDQTVAAVEARMATMQARLQLV